MFLSLTYDIRKAVFVLFTCQFQDIQRYIYIYVSDSEPFFAEILLNLKTFVCYSIALLEIAKLVGNNVSGPRISFGGEYFSGSYAKGKWWKMILFDCNVSKNLRAFCSYMPPVMH